MKRKLIELEQAYPMIPWREPVQVAWMGAGETHACRVCIANHGLKRTSRWQWPQLQQAEHHIQMEHIRKP